MKRANILSWNDKVYRVLGSYHDVCLKPLVRNYTDLMDIFTWRNRADVRGAFINSDKITWQQHLDWFERYDKRLDDLMWIVLLRGESVGTYALYNITSQKGEMGRLMIGVPSARGFDLGYRMICMVRDFALDELHIPLLHCTIKSANKHVIRINLRAGFEIVTADDGTTYMEMKR